MNNKIGILLLAGAMVILFIATFAMLSYNKTPISGQLGTRNISTADIKIVYITPKIHPYIPKINNNLIIFQINSNINNSISRLIKYINNEFLLIIDLNTTQKNYINLVKQIFKEAVIIQKKPLVMIGSPNKIKEVVSTTAGAYAIPIYIMRGKDPSNLNITRIKTLIFAYIPAKNRRFGGISVSNIVEGTEISQAIYETISKVQKYMHSQQATPVYKLSFTLPSSTTILLAQADSTLSKKPYGKINAKDALYQVIDDGNPNYNWFIYQFIDQIIPGDQLWNNEWRNNKLIQELDADAYDPLGFLSDYSPSTYVSATTKTTTVTLGFSAGKDKDGISVGGSLTIGWSWSYQKPDIEIIDRSDFSDNLAKWENKINKDKAVGESTVKLEPGAIARFPEDSQQHPFKTAYIGQWAKKDCLVAGHLCSWDYSDYQGFAIEWILVPP